MLRRFLLLAVLVTAACSHSSPLDPPAAAGSFAPHLARFGRRIVMSWVEPGSSGAPSLRFAVREGEGWSVPLTVVADARLASDSSDVPSVVPLGSGALAATWTVKRGTSKDARDVMLSVSGTKGRTWGSPKCPHRDRTDTEHGMATIVPLDDRGGFGILWLDGRAGATSAYGEGGTALYWADSNGLDISDERLLDDRVCDCCKTSAARGPAGPLIAYRDRSDTDVRDTSLVRREGATWSSPSPVHADGWTLTACPTNGPSIAAQGSRAVVTWFTGANGRPAVWAAFSADGGKSVGTPVRVDDGNPVGRVEATMLADGSTALAWLERRGDIAEVRARRLGPTGTPGEPIVVATTSPARASGYPAIVEDLDRRVLVAWTETGSRSRVHASLVSLK